MALSPTAWLLLYLHTCAAAFPCATVSECLRTTLWHIPGPNPLVGPRATSRDWESEICEVAGGVFKSNGTYYLIYHCAAKDKPYSVGISTAPHPLGPWTPTPAQPNLPGSPGEDAAGMCIIPDPERPGHWLGYYEFAKDPGPPTWSLNLARAPTPLGPWLKRPETPALLPWKKVCDRKKQFSHECDGLYVGAVLHGPETNNEYWIYLEAPISDDDEGPMALWSSRNQTGPFERRGYVLDGGNKGGWDNGRYSESRVVHAGGLFHLFITASSAGSPHPNKDTERIGWAISDSGMNFTEHPCNPMVRPNATTPHTASLSEGHVWIEDPLIYVFHTIGWDDDKDKFAPHGRNGEDLGVDILSPSTDFNFTMPLITKHWKLHLSEGQESPCVYDRVTQRYCAPIKVVISASGTTKVLTPTLSFIVSGVCTSNITAIVNVYRYDEGKGPLLSSLHVQGSSCAAGEFSGVTMGAEFERAMWVLVTVATKEGPLGDVRLAVRYHQNRPARQLPF